ncbi:MAG: HAD-IA family hydrolase [Gammaproteobacteria bacterium]|nr:HAD-IA family hydrolase [Gammaproteobacteria bacterium]
MMIRAILWDFGGVLTTSPFEAFNRFERANNVPTDFIRGINATNPQTNAWAQFESSQISLDEFDEKFAEESAAAGHRVGGKQVIELLSGNLRPKMVSVLKTCKTKFQVACITNNVKSGVGPGMARNERRVSEVAQVMELFDLVVESSIEGIRKPDPRIYALTCERLGIDPENAVFLDDLGTNLKPARALGMRTIKVIGEDDAIAELAEITGLTF